MLVTLARKMLSTCGLHQMNPHKLLNKIIVLNHWNFKHLIIVGNPYSNTTLYSHEQASTHPLSIRPVPSSINSSHYLSLSTAHFCGTPYHMLFCRLKSHPYSVQPSIIFFSDLLLCIHIKAFILFFVQSCCFVLVVLVVSLFL